MSSATRNGKTRDRSKATSSPDVLIQLISFARILARQAVREVIATQKFSTLPSDKEKNTDGNV